MDSTIPTGDAAGTWSPAGSADVPTKDGPVQAVTPEPTAAAALSVADALPQYQPPTSHDSQTVAVSFADTRPAPLGHRSVGSGISQSTSDCMAAFHKGAGAGWGTVAFTSAHNGGREVLVAVPPGVDLARPVEVVTYLHGLYTRIGKVLAGNPDPTNSDGNLSAEMAALAKGPPARNVVFVLPEMKANQAYQQDPGAQGGNREWLGSGESLQGTVTDALAHLQPTLGSPLTVSQIAVVGHSYGGKAIANALTNGTMPPGAHISVLDGTYWSELPALLASHAKAHPPARITVTFIDGSQTAGIGNAVKPGPNVVVTHVPPPPPGKLMPAHMQLAHEHFARGIPAPP